jgi:5'-3' exonuclease
MGIQGLLKGLQSFSEKANIRHFLHQSIAVDASSWLHKSVYSISEVFVEATERSQSHLDATSLRVSSTYLRKRCQELISSAKVRKIVLVFDGKRCPLKAETNEERDERRQKYLKEARLYKKRGLRAKAEEKYKMCIKIHTSFADAVAKELQKHFAQDQRVQFIFSPYEADAQLARLCADKSTDAVITEDSDVLVYSVTCNVPFPIIYKLDRNTGDCDVLNMNWLLCPSPQRSRIATNSKSGSLESILQSLVDRQYNSPGFGARLFVQSCVFAGSDYSPNKLNGIGIVTAFKMLRDNAHRPCDERFKHVLAGIQKKNKGSEDLNLYETLLSQSESVFYYHLVFNEKKNLSYLNAPRLLNMVVKNEIEYRPVLDRHQQNLWFLGDVSQQQSILDFESVFNEKIRFPIKNAVLVEKETPETRSIYEPESDDSETYRLMQCAKNPVNQKRKSYEVDDSTNRNNKASNPFGNFAHVPSNNGDCYSIFVSNRKDFRFTKRKFSSNGKPINPNYKLNSSMALQQTQLSFLPNTSMKDALARNKMLKHEGRGATICEDFGKCEKTENVAVFEEDKENFLDRIMDPSPCLGFESERNSSPSLEAASEHSLNDQLSGIELEEQLDTSKTSCFIPSLTRAHIILRENMKPCFQMNAQYDQLETQMNTNLNEIDDSDEDCARSKYFRRHIPNLRRVTLETPDYYLNDLEKLGTHAYPTHSAVKSEVEVDSPGGDSVISEVDEMLAAAIPYQRITKDSRHFKNVKFGTCESRLLDFEEVPETELFYSSMTPFCSNSKTVNDFKKYSSLTCNRKPELPSSWIPYTESISRDQKNSRFQKNYKEPTSTYIYNSAITKEYPDDDSFLGL